MLSDDPTVQISIIGIITTLITTIGVVLVAALTSRKAVDDHRDDDMEASLRERIALRDDQIADLRADREALRDRLEDALAENRRSRTIIARLREGIGESEGEEV